jgi:hypothetical protein
MVLLVEKHQQNYNFIYSTLTLGTLNKKMIKHRFILEKIARPILKVWPEFRLGPRTNKLHAWHPKLLNWFHSGPK